MKYLVTDLILPISGFLSSFLVAYSVLPYIIQMIKKMKLMDVPCGRSSHSVSTPSSGGLSFVVAFLFSMIAIPSNSMIYPMIYVGIGLMTMGFLDDLYDLAASVKFIGQFIGASILFYIGYGLNDLNGLLGLHQESVVIAYLLTVFFVIGIVNAFNLIDGIDGLAGGLGLIDSFVFGVLFLFMKDIHYSLMAFSFCGCLFAFLRFNFNPARIFMGDTGSLVLGLLMGVFFLRIFNFGEVLFSTVALSLVVFPALDMTRLFIYRLFNGNSPFSADRNHYHHLLMRSGNDHKQAAINMYYLQVILIATSTLAGIYLGLTTAFISVLGLAILTYILIEIRQYLTAMHAGQNLRELREKELDQNRFYKWMSR